MFVDQASYFVFFFNDTATTEIYTLSLRRSSDLQAHAPGADRHRARRPARRPRGRRRGAAPDLLRDRVPRRSEEHTSELQSRRDLVCRLLLEKKNNRPV